MDIGCGKAVDVHIPCLWTEFCALLCLWVTLFPHSHARAGLWKSHLWCASTSAPQFPYPVDGISSWLFYSVLKLDEPQAQLSPASFLFLSPHHICSSFWVSISSPRLVFRPFGLFCVPNRELCTCFSIFWNPLCHILWLTITGISEVISSETPIPITPLCQAQARDSPPVSL